MNGKNSLKSVGFRIDYPADIMTKPNPQKAQSTLADCNELKIRLDGRVKREQGDFLL